MDFRNSGIEDCRQVCGIDPAAREDGDSPARPPDQLCQRIQRMGCAPLAARGEDASETHLDRRFQCLKQIGTQIEGAMKRQRKWPAALLALGACVRDPRRQQFGVEVSCGIAGPDNHARQPGFGSYLDIVGGQRGLGGAIVEIAISRACKQVDRNGRKRRSPDQRLGRSEAAQRKCRAEFYPVGATGNGRIHTGDTIDTYFDHLGSR
jgi:hypothetical protein